MRADRTKTGDCTGAAVRTRRLPRAARIVICPCCNGAGKIEEKSPVDLSPLQFRIWDIVRKSKHGILGSELVDRVYAHRADGGPLYAATSVYVQIMSTNKRLAAVNQRIVSSGGHGAIYRLEHF